MRAVTFQEPGRIALEERPEPEPLAPDDAVVRVEATGICGSDLHIYHGRVQIEPGFTLGHEYVGTIVAAGDAVAPKGGDRGLGTFPTASRPCFFCRRRAYHKCGQAPRVGGVAGAGAAVGHPAALDTACRLARKGGTVSVVGVYAERVEVHMGVVWIKSLKLITGHANVMGHLDNVLAMLASGRLDVSPLVSREMRLEDDPEAYEAYDRHEALKILLRT